MRARGSHGWDGACRACSGFGPNISLYSDQEVAREEFCPGLGIANVFVRCSRHNWDAYAPGAGYEQSAADLAAIKTDQAAALPPALKTTEPTLIADGKAIAAALKTARASVPAALTTQLKTDSGTVTTDLKTLFNDYMTKATAAKITADKAALKAAETAVGNDLKAIQTSINTNAGVVAAEAKLKADSATVTADEATLQAAYKKLFTDLKNHASSCGSSRHPLLPFPRALGPSQSREPFFV